MICIRQDPTKVNADSGQRVLSGHHAVGIDQFPAIKFMWSIVVILRVTWSESTNSHRQDFPIRVTVKLPARSRGGNWLIPTTWPEGLTKVTYMTIPDAALVIQSTIRLRNIASFGLISTLISMFRISSSSFSQTRCAYRNLRGIHGHFTLLLPLVVRQFNLLIQGDLSA